MIIFDPSEHSPTKCQGMLAQVIAPRPIAMISTANEDGVANVAPYSYFMAITGDPMLVGVTMGALRSSDGEPKHTYVNAMRSGELVINVTTDTMGDHIETAALEFPGDQSEASAIGWTPVPSQVVAAPSIAESPVHLECRVYDVIDLGDPTVLHSGVHLVLAEVVCLVMDESVASEDYRVDQAQLRPVGRMGFPWFNRATESSMYTLPRLTYDEYVSNAAATAP